jgi:FtsP/CotA-like multicopper oxidase with cupredoxin domain
MLNRRQFLKISAAAGAGLAVPWRLPAFAARRPRFQIPGGSLSPNDVPKYVSKLVIPPAMPTVGGTNNYEIAVRQFQQHIVPASMGLPMTTVWSYGSTGAPGTVAEGGTFNYPAFTIEAQHGQPVTVKWINDLVASNGNFLPHILPVDQTLHWANPPGGIAGRDTSGTNPDFYMGPVPIVTHVHGMEGIGDESDGYTEAWYLPAANNIPAGYAVVGSWYDRFKAKAASKFGDSWQPGSATFHYPNSQRASTAWYHDHSLGMTRVNVYAGPAGFYLVRGGSDDLVGGELPGPAPGVGDDPFGTYYEIPVVIQDRSFNDDGSLFYPDNRAFFEELDEEQLQIPFIPDQACDGQASDIAPIWNPEFFGNVMVVNGVSWPYLEVEKRRYRLRFLNGSNSRFLILKMSNGQKFYQIGSEGGFLPQTVELDQLVMAPAERADVILDFTNVSAGTEIILQNVGPDEPFKGFNPDGSLADGEGGEQDPSDPGTTGQVMQFRVVAATGSDPSTPPMDLELPAIAPLGAADNTRELSLNEEESATVRVSEDGDNVVLDCAEGEPFAPKAALLGTLNPDGTGKSLLWMDEVTENPTLGDTEVWEIHNFTEDAHPIHVHEVFFQVVNREEFEGDVRDPESWETGWKETVIAYPREITRIKAQFNTPGRYVWHCHIVEHEDNEMMRPYDIVPDFTNKIFMPFAAKDG